jgi:hypothetical protein
MIALARRGCKVGPIPRPGSLNCSLSLKEEEELKNPDSRAILTSGLARGNKSYLYAGCIVIKGA